MNREDLQHLLRQRPFQPFRVVLHDGRTYEIKYPRMNLLAESFINIGIPDETGPKPLCDHTEHVRLAEIARTELLPVPPSSASWKVDRERHLPRPALNRDDLQRLLRQRPFQPFRVILHDGRTYEIKYPRMNLLAESFIKIGIPDETGPKPLCDHTEYVRLAEIVQTELLPAPPSSAS